MYELSEQVVLRVGRTPGALGSARCMEFVLAFVNLRTLSARASN